MDLENKVVIITGASRGLGKEIALELDSYGCKIVLVARTIEELKKVQKKLKSNSIIIKADLSNELDIKRIFKLTNNKFDTIDLLINNAAINIKKYFYDITNAEYDKLMAINTKAVVLSTKEFYKFNKEGVVVIISSMAGWFSEKYYSIYSASKHALEGFMKGAKKDCPKMVFKMYHPYRLKTNFGENYKVKSPKHKINPRLYAQYVVSSIKGDRLRMIYLFIRNHLMWIYKIVNPQSQQ